MGNFGERSGKRAQHTPGEAQSPNLSADSTTRGRPLGWCVACDSSTVLSGDTSVPSSRGRTWREDGGWCTLRADPASDMWHALQQRAGGHWPQGHLTHSSVSSSGYQMEPRCPVMLSSEPRLRPSFGRDLRQGGTCWGCAGTWGWESAPRVTGAFSFPCGKGLHLVKNKG